MGIPDDIAALTARVAALEKAIAALDVPPGGSTPTSVFNAVNVLTDRQRKELWRMLRDGG